MVTLHDDDDDNTNDDDDDSNIEISYPVLSVPTYEPDDDLFGFNSSRLPTQQPNR